MYHSGTDALTFDYVRFSFDRNGTEPAFAECNFNATQLDNYDWCESRSETCFIS